MRFEPGIPQRVKIALRKHPWCAYFEPGEGQALPFWWLQNHFGDVLKLGQGDAIRQLGEEHAAFAVVVSFLVLDGDFGLPVAAEFNGRQSPGQDADEFSGRPQQDVTQRPVNNPTRVPIQKQMATQPTQKQGGYAPDVIADRRSMPARGGGDPTGLDA